MSLKMLYRRMKVESWVFLTGVAAIVFFFTLTAISISLLPAAIDAELDRRIAIVEAHLGGRAQ